MTECLKTFCQSLLMSDACYSFAETSFGPILALRTHVHSPKPLEATNAQGHCWFRGAFPGSPGCVQRVHELGALRQIKFDQGVAYANDLHFR
jgi:hypothetical protein